MRKKFTKKIMPLLMAGVLVLGGSLSNVSAKGNTGIGKIALSSTTAKAITTISSASAPANGFAGYAKITAYSSSGKKATNTVMSAASKTTSTVSYKEIKAKFTKAKKCTQRILYGIRVNEFYDDFRKKNIVNMFYELISICNAYCR